MIRRTKIVGEYCEADIGAECSWESFGRWRWRSTACSADQSAGKMTSFSSKESKGQTPGLFTIPADQMSHVQVVTVAPSDLPRVLRLTGAVSYNAFNTTPVITQVGGPVSRLLAVPGERVKKGQSLLEVSSPDYSLLYASYLKARDTFRVADKNYDRAKDLYEHHAIAERDLLSAESDRIQAQADLNASLAGIENSGNPEAGRSGKVADLGNSFVRADRRRNRGTRRGSRATAAGGRDPGFHHFGHEFGVGASQYLPERSGGREEWETTSSCRPIRIPMRSTGKFRLFRRRWIRPRGRCRRGSWSITPAKN